LRSVTGQERAG